MTKEQIIAAIRGRIGVTALTDDEIYEIYETYGKNVDCAAAEIWNRKAANAGDLMDIKEGSSDRKLSQLAAQAQGQAKYFRSLCEAESGIVDPTNRPSKTIPIVRP